ncbi:hypothetical protein [Endothiovibrio diazotrophicus]
MPPWWRTTPAPPPPPEYIALRRRLLDTAQRLAGRLGERPEGDPAALLDDEAHRLIDALDAQRVDLDPANYGW